MILRHLRYFLAAAEEGSVARAARRLRVAQPALTRAIHQLESSVGLQLLERAPQGVFATTAGAEFCRRAYEVLAQIEVAVDRAKRAELGLAGELRLGISGTAMAVPEVSRGIARIHTLLPGMRTTLVNSPTGEHEAELRAGRLDIAVGAGALDGIESLREVTLAEGVLDCALLASSHPLAGRERISVDDLRGQPYLFFERAHAALNRELFRALDKAGFPEREAYGSVEGMNCLIAAGHGWTLSGSAFAGASVANTRLVPLADLGVKYTIRARVRSNDHSRVIERALALLRDEPAERLDLVPTADESSRVVMAIELRHLRAFSAAARHGSLSRGADSLGLTQSGLSRQLQALETALDVRLLDRLSTSVVPTVAGRLFLADVTPAVGELEQSLPDRASPCERCRIGTRPAELTSGMVIAALRRLQESAPNVPLDVSEMLSTELEQAVIGSRVDVAVATSLASRGDHPALARATLAEDIIDCALVAESHPLANRSLVAASELSNYPLLFIERGDSPLFFDRVIAALEQCGWHRTLGGTYQTPRTIWALVSSTNGWCIGFRAQRLNVPPGLRAVPIDGLRLVGRQELIWRSDDRRPITRTVIEAFLAAEKAATPHVLPRIHAG